MVLFGRKLVMWPLGAVFVVLWALCKGAFGLQCWECNSKTDPGCMDPFNGYSLGSVNCSQADEDVEHLRDDNGILREPVVCRKTIQVVQEEIRIIRGCGWIPNEGIIKGRKCFNRVGTMGVSVRHCTCNSDGCNGSGNLTPGHSVLAASATSCLSAFFLLSRILVNNVH